RVVNMLRVAAPQQVMLEVKIAEVSKTLIDNFGLDFSRISTSADGLTSNLISGIIGGGAGAFGRFTNNVTPAANVTGAAASGVANTSSIAAASLGTLGRRATLLGIDAQKKDGL